MLVADLAKAHDRLKPYSLPAPQSPRERASEILQAFGATPLKPQTANSQPFRIEGRAGVVMLAGIKSDWELQQRVSLGLAEAGRERFATKSTQTIKLFKINQDGARR